MKQCPNCHTACQNHEQFCPACGTRLMNTGPSAGWNPGPQSGQSFYTKKKNTRKIWLIVLAVVLILSAAGGTGFYFWQKSENDKKQEQEARYAENIEAGERYLLDQDYSRAETSYRSAISIEPRKPEPYIGLYEVYAAQNDETKKAGIEKEAQTSLSADDYSTFEKAAEEIDERYRPVDNVSVITEIGSLDTIPIRINNEIWVIRQNGQYSFMNDQGEIVNDAPSDFFQMLMKDDNKAAACLADDYSDYEMSSTNQWPNNDGLISNCSGYGGTGPVMDIELTEEGKPMITDQSMDGYNYFAERESQGNPSGNRTYRNPIDELPLVPVALRKHGDTNPDEYWIWNPIADKVSGPYSTKENGALAMTLIGDSSASFSDPLREGQSESITAARYMRIFSPYQAQENGQTTLWSRSGQATIQELENISDVKIIDIGALSFQKDGLSYLLDGELNPLLVSRFEEVSGPIENRMLMKTDGTWKLVEFSENEAADKDRQEITHHIHRIDMINERPIVDYVVKDSPLYKGTF